VRCLRTATVLSIKSCTITIRDAPTTNVAAACCSVMG
jgi:hypothetical protein